MIKLKDILSENKKAAITVITYKEKRYGDIEQYTVYEVDGVPEYKDKRIYYGAAIKGGKAWSLPLLKKKLKEKGYTNISVNKVVSKLNY